MKPIAYALIVASSLSACTPAEPQALVDTSTPLDAARTSDVGMADGAPALDASAAVDAALDAAVAAVDAPISVDAPVDLCVGDPGIRPAGFTEYRRSWEQVFFGRSYPTTPSFLTPVGSFTISRPRNDGPRSAGMYISIPFTPEAARSVTLRFNPAQSVATDEGTSIGRPGDFLVSVSPCPGDLRGPAPDDMWLSDCRIFGTEVNLTFGTLPANRCRLEAGRTYYLNFAATDPSVLNPEVNSCRGGSERCEINVR